MSRNGNRSQWNSRRRTRSSGQSEEYGMHNQFKEHWTKISSNLHNLRQKSKFCDVEIKVEDQLFRAHRIILSASSSYFEAMFTAGLREEKLPFVEIHDVAKSTFELLLDFIYTGNIIIEEDNVQELLPAANMIRLEGVVNRCCDFLNKQFDKTNCVGIFLFAEMHSCTNLKVEAKKFIERNFTDVIREEEFLNLPKDALKSFLRSEGLSIYSEFEVFEATVKWILKDPGNRKHFLTELMSAVRLPVIPTKQMDEYIDMCQDEELRQRLRDLLNVYKEQYNVDGTLNDTSGLSVSDGYMNIRSHPRMSCRKSVYVIGGVCQTVNGYHDGRTLVTVEKLDTFKGQWKPMLSMREPRSCHGVALLQNRIYIAGGETDALIYNSVEILDPINEEWLSAKDMLQPRTCFGMCSVGEFIYALGGCVGDSVDSSVERYDAKRDEWEYWGDIGVRRYGMGVCSVNGLIYIFGGYDEYRCVQNSCFVYDPSTKMLRKLRTMYGPRAEFGVGELHGFIYVTGGTNGRNSLNSVERYSLTDNKWTRVLCMPRPRISPCVASINNTLLVIGGREANDSNTLSRTLDSVEVYYPEENKWRESLAMPTSRCDAAVAVL